MATATGSWSWDDSPESLVEVLKGGGVVVIPTESTYALAADPAHPDGVARVFAIKRRPANKPLPVVVGDTGQLERLGVKLPAAGLGGLERAWPGAVTLLLECAPGLPAAAGSARLAVRIPGHERLRRLLLDMGLGVTATSANVSGRQPITDPREAAALVAGEQAVVIDDGILGGGPPSTMVALEGRRARIVRSGRVSRARLEDIASDWFSAATVEIPVEDDG